MKLFEYIKAKSFFPRYASKVIDWRKKMSGKNGRGNPLDFSEQDKVQIKKGFAKLASEVERW